MAKVFFTSDLHFGHKNLCEGLRGMTAEDSDALIISNWNKVVFKERYSICTWRHHYGEAQEHQRLYIKVKRTY